MEAEGSDGPYKTQIGPPTASVAGLKGELTRLAADISAIDRVTRMLDPDHLPKADPSRR